MTTVVGTEKPLAVEKGVIVLFSEVIEGYDDTVNELLEELAYLDSLTPDPKVK